MYQKSLNGFEGVRQHFLKLVYFTLNKLKSEILNDKKN